MLGSLKLRNNGHTYTVLGGPYSDIGMVKAPTFGVCLRETVPPNTTADLHFPIVDFQTPDMGDARYNVDKIVREVLNKDKFVYMGCMAGRGRTGLMMALLYKTFHKTDGATSVRAVRKEYYPHAVETKEQAKFVEDFTPLFRTRARLMFNRWFGV